MNVFWWISTKFILNSMELKRISISKMLEFRSLGYLWYKVNNVLLAALRLERGYWISNELFQSFVAYIWFTLNMKFYLYVRFTFSFFSPNFGIISLLSFITSDITCGCGVLGNVNRLLVLLKSHNFITHPFLISNLCIFVLI